MERKPFGKRLFISFMIASLIFISGFLVSYMVNSYQYRAISESQERLRYSLLEQNIQKDLIDCGDFDPYMFAKEMDYVGSITEILEQNFGKQNRKVIEQKKIYSLIQLQHFLIVKENQEKCNNTIDTILFFYSNKPIYSDDAEKIGRILNLFKKDKELMIYSFDFDIDSTTLKILKEKYNVSKPNSIIINEKSTLENIENIDELKGYI